jgi:hypothetical protein
MLNRQRNFAASRQTMRVGETQGVVGVEGRFRRRTPSESASRITASSSSWCCTTIGAGWASANTADDRAGA